MAEIETEADAEKTVDEPAKAAKVAKIAKIAKVDPVVYALYRASRCHGCDRKLEKGEIVKLEQGLEEQRAFCSKCSELDGLEILPSGNAKITRLAKKYSPRTYVVMRWSEVWKAYERQGLFVEPKAIDQAESEAGIKLLNRPARQS